MKKYSEAQSKKNPSNICRGHAMDLDIKFIFGIFFIGIMVIVAIVAVLG